MKRRLNRSAGISAVQIAFCAALLSLSAVLLASGFRALPVAGDDAGSSGANEPAAPAAVTSATLPSLPVDVVNVTQHHNNPSRDGLFIDPAFTLSAAANVTRDTGFNGTIVGNVYAQPLYIEGGPGGAAMVIAVTESNNVYALDATTGNIIWQRNVGTPITSGLPCGNINPLGITGTPVVDLASRSLFFDAEINGIGHQIFSLNVDTGATNAGWPVTLNTAVSGFDSSVQSERAALGIVGNTVYVPYGGRFGDCGSYRGRLVGVQMNNPAAVMGWATGTTRAGVWAPGGVASDGTNTYVTTGNGSGTTWAGNEAVIRLQPGPIFSGSTTDYWAPTNWMSLDSADSDLGGSGPIVVDVPGATPSALVVAIGKDRNAYLLNRNNLGGVSAPLAQAVVSSGTIINAACAYRTSLSSYVVLRPVSGTLTAFKITATNPPTIATGWSVSSSGRSSPFVTSTDGTNNVIVWAFGVGASQRLFGYNGDTGALVYAGGGVNDTISGTRSFNTGIAARGRIYVAGDNKVYAFSVPQTSPTPTPTASPSPTPTPRPTPSPTPRPTPTPTPTSTPSPTPTPTPTPIPTPPQVEAVYLPVSAVGTTVNNFMAAVTTTEIDPNIHGNLQAFQGDFTYDSTVVAFQGSPVSVGDVMTNNGGSWSLAANANLTNTTNAIKTCRVTAFCSNNVGLSTDGAASNTLFKLNLVRVSSTPGASTALTWSAPPDRFRFFDVEGFERVPGSEPPGSITIQEQVSISGAISYCAGSVRSVPNVTMSLSGDISTSAMSDGTGQYQLSGIPAGGNYSVTPSAADLLPGVDSHGININEALSVQQHINSNYTLLSGCAEQAAHTNGNNTGNPASGDCLFIQQYVDNEPLPPANRTGQWRFVPAQRTYSNLSGNQTGENYDAYVLGDPLGNVIFPSAAPPVAPRALAVSAAKKQNR